MGDEPVSQVGQRAGNAVAKSNEGTSAVSNGGGAPLFEPAAVRREGCGFRGLHTSVGQIECVLIGCALSRRCRARAAYGNWGFRGNRGDAAGVNGEEKEPEFGVALVVEDVIEVELDVGLFGEAGGVP